MRIKVCSFTLSLSLSYALSLPLSLSLSLSLSLVVRSISAHKASIHCLDFHRYGDILASGSLDTNIKVTTASYITFILYIIQLWDVRRKGCLYTYKGHSESVNAVQFSPDGKWLISGSSDNSVKVSTIVTNPFGLSYNALYSSNELFTYSSH